jgi:hypothetical protein
MEILEGSQTAVKPKSEDAVKAKSEDEKAPNFEKWRQSGAIAVRPPLSQGGAGGEGATPV